MLQGETLSPTIKMKGYLKFTLNELFLKKSLFRSVTVLISRFWLMNQFLQIEMCTHNSQYGMGKGIAWRKLTLIGWLSKC